MKYASIDIGTNSTRLLVVGCGDSSTATLSRMMRITRLGEGVDKNRELTGTAMERTLDALLEYREVIDSNSPAATRAVATSALRDTTNGWQFLEMAEEVLGVRPEVISGAEEAALSYTGAVCDLDESQREPAGLLVFDIGGGSTEVMTASGAPALPIGDCGWLTSRSIDVGCVRMSERFLSVDPPSPIALGRMESFLITKLKPAIRYVAPESVQRAVGLAGTVTTLSAMKLGLKEYDTDRIHHSRLTRSDVEDMFRKLAAAGLEERKEIMGIEPGRADVIVGGAAVLRAIMDIAGIEELLVSEKDILDGIVLDLAARSGSGGR